MEELGGRRLDQGLRVRFDTQRSHQNPAEDGIDYTAQEKWLTFGTAAKQKQTVEYETFRTRENRGDRIFSCRIGADTSLAAD